MMKTFLAFVGGVAIVVGLFGGALLVSFLIDANRVPGILENSLATIESAGPMDNTVRLVEVEDVPVVSGNEVVLETPMVATAPPTPTAYFAPATATPQLSAQFLADCAFAQSNGRRSHPSCPSNAAEMLGPGR